MKYIGSLIVVCSLLSGQIMWEEYFTDGNMQLNWHPWFTDSLGYGDSMSVINDPTTPGGDSWAGRISNEYMGVAGLTYAGTQSMADYSIEAWVYTVVSSGSGPYNGIAARLNPTSRYYYRLVSDFDSNARLRLGFVGSGGYPVALRDWTGGEIPGGVPGSSSWHRLELSVSHDSLWCYYDDQELPGCPVINDSVSSGYFGIYTFNMADTASTKCDNIIVVDVTGIAEQNTAVQPVLSVFPNPFRDRVSISYQVRDLSIPNSILQMSIYDAAGRLIRQFENMTTEHRGCISWDGSDNKGNSVLPGVYFVVDNKGCTREHIVKIR